jgi:hypothetical protein
MAISKSGRKEQVWTAGAHLYSGRPDPTWNISAHVVQKLQELWESMTRAGETRVPRSGGLGYRGSFVRGPGGRVWVAFKQLVSLTTPAGTEVRTDTAQEFEKTVLSSAPKGLLPKGLSEGQWRLPADEY